MMPRPQGGLGRGLGAIIPPATQSSTTAEPLSSDAAGDRDRGEGRRGGPVHDGNYVELPLDAVVVNQLQPRQVFAEDALESLASSIEQFGVLQPIVVRRRADSQTYELIAGERRWRASRLAGRKTVPAVVRTSSNQSSLVEALVENVQREDLNPLEEAGAFQQLIDDFEVTHAELATRLGKGRTTISNSLRLLELPAAAQTAVMEEKISAGHARALLACSSASRQIELLRKIIDENLSVRATERLAKDSAREAGESTRIRRTQNPIPDASVLEVEARLTDHLNTTVSVRVGQNKGKILIEFATLSDLQRIYDVICEGD